MVVSLLVAALMEAQVAAIVEMLILAMLLLIVWKYIKEQTPLMLGLVRSVLRRSRMLFRA